MVVERLPILIEEKEEDFCLQPAASFCIVLEICEKV